MNELLHFVPLTETVTIRGQKIKLLGIDLADLGQLFFRFPALIDIARMIEAKTFDVAKAHAAKPAMVAMVVAGAGHAGDEAMEKSFSNLALGEILDLWKSVFRLTSPGGIGPFVELVVAVKGPGAAAEAPPAKERKGAKIRVRP